MIDPALNRARGLALPMVVAAVQIGASFPAGSGQAERRSIDVLAVCLLLCGPLALLLVRRLPYLPPVVATAAACTFLLLGYPYGPVFLSVIVGLFLAGQLGRRAVVLPLGLASAVAILATAAFDPRGDGVGPVHGLLVLGWLAAVHAGSEIVLARRSQLAEQRRNDQLAREQQLADERMGLARELHDVLAHNISLINVQASVALHLLDQQPERAASALAHIKAASAEALDELRAALDVLRGGTPPRSPSPRLADLDDLIDGVRAGGLRVNRTGGPVPPDLPTALELAAYRIVQEALTNVTRHARARTVRVSIDVVDDHLDVVVVDDGKGPSAASVDGRGLTGMRERSTALGGTLRAGPAAGGGFEVAARLPLPAP